MGGSFTLAVGTHAAAAALSEGSAPVKAEARKAWLGVHSAGVAVAGGKGSWVHRDGKV